LVSFVAASEAGLTMTMGNQRLPLLPDYAIIDQAAGGERCGDLLLSLSVLERNAPVRVLGVLHRAGISEWYWWAKQYLPRVRLSREAAQMVKRLFSRDDAAATQYSALTSVTSPADWLDRNPGSRQSGDWRCPIVVTEARRTSDWRQCVQLPRLLLHPYYSQTRGGEGVLVDHVSPSADMPFYGLFDPWWIEPLFKGRHPKRLPRPPVLAGNDAPGSWQGKLQSVDDVRSFKVGDRLYYVPPNDWNPQLVSATDWLRGRAFPTGRLAERSGPVDRRGRVWWWHAQEEHWDVQVTPRLTVSHTGEVLKVS
jgi:hypothetical protein